MIQLVFSGLRSGQRRTEFLLLQVQLGSQTITKGKTNFPSVFFGAFSQCKIVAAFMAALLAFKMRAFQFKIILPSPFSDGGSVLRRSFFNNQSFGFV
jgi:hypothetical protein